MVMRRAEGTDRCMEEEDLRGAGGSGNMEEVGQIWGGEVVDGLEVGGSMQTG